MAFSPRSTPVPARPTRPPGGRAVHDPYNELLRRWMWRDAATVTLAVWLLSSPFTLGYEGSPQAWNDLICGAALALLGTLALWPRFDPVRWAIASLGLWLLFAPLVFWTAHPAAYANATLVGSLAIAFSVLIPAPPGRAHYDVMLEPGPETPPGWSYNPSDWIQRGPIIAMAFLGFFLSRYLAAYQLGHIANPWDPFFGDGTRRVLDSEVSKAFPVSDAGLGAVSYLLEALSGFMGGRTRWRTLPWMVLLFGVLVVPLGVVSVVLVILQPIGVGAWCTLCLITTGAMLIMIAPAMDEMVAMGQFLSAARRQGQPLWRVFWIGGTLDRGTEGERPRVLGSAHARERSLLLRIVAAVDLNNVPPTLLVCAALGLWLMAVPAVLGAGGAAADAHYMAGALAVTWAVIGFSEIARPVRLLNVLTGLAVVAVPWIVPGSTELSRWNDVGAGLVLIVSSVPRGRIEERFGTWNRFLVW